MSDTQESTSSASDKEESSKPVCRDFLQGCCIRGPECRYRHTDDGEDVKSKGSVDRPKLLTFCHNFQNGKCIRYPCKFLHCTDEEEDHYRLTGELPERIIKEELPFNKFIAADLITAKSGDRMPACKDYLNGECTRRNCRFRHISMRALEKLNSKLGVFRGPGEEPMFHRRGDIGRPPRGVVADFEPAFKRRRFMDTPFGQPNGMRPDRAILDENALLRQRVDELQKRVDDLLATNEFLLEQNAQMRINDKGAASLTAVTVPAVTITNSAQMQPAQAPNHQVMNAAIRTVTASVATVPVSIAAVAGTPCSIATVSMAPVPISPSVVTMAQPSGQNPPAGPQALPMSMSEPQGPSLVSYPIMTRPVLQSNITH